MKIEKIVKTWMDNNAPSIYAEGLSWYEAIIILTSKLNDVIDQINLYFNEDLEDVVTKILNEWLDDGTIQVIISEALQTQIDDVENKQRLMDDRLTAQLKETTSRLEKTDMFIRNNVSSNINNDGAINRILSIAQSYQNNADKLHYGNGYTAYDKIVKPIGSTFEIDCSSFMNLLIHGVTFENSRYNGHDTNIEDTSFFNDIDSYKYRYANLIGKYGFENGYAFYPNDDLTNVKAGDILFFSWKDFDTKPEKYTDEQMQFHNEAFMKIDHVGMFLKRKNDSSTQLINFDNGITNVIYEANNEYMNQCVLVVRFPFVGPDIYNENLIVNGNKKYSINTGTKLAEYSIRKPLEKNKFYTAFIKGQCYTVSSYFLIMYGGSSVYTDFGKILPYNKEYNKFVFRYNGDSTDDFIRVHIGAEAPAPNDRVGTIESFELFEGFVSDKNNYFEEKLFVYDLPLDSDLPEVSTDSVPMCTYSVDKNKVNVQISLYFNDNIKGSKDIITLPPHLRPSKTQRLPVILTQTNGSIIGNAYIQVSVSGKVSVSLFDPEMYWKMIICNGFYYL